MYSVFVNLMRDKGVNAATVARETGISPTTLSEWKNGRSTPKQDKLQKIADYFGISLDYLVTGLEPEQKEKPSALSEELNKNEIVIRGRDGRYVKKKLSDGQLEALKMMIEQLPDVPDDL